MARYNKNWGRCYISKKRLSFVNKLLIILGLVLLATFFFILYIDKRVNAILDQYINIEVERLTGNIVNRAVSEVMSSEDYKNILQEGLKDGHISYKTQSINKLTDKISLYVHDKLMNLEAGDIPDLFVVDRFRNGKFKKMDNGILCDISLGSVRNSSLFANVGPTIPIKLTFTGVVNAELDVKIKEYGINNVIVEMDVIVKVREHASMPLTSKRKDIVVKEPISIEIIKGEIPDYYNGVLN
ncbi:MAG: sporulation protein YunB [Bacilli bacterium]|nr:sporulation protein YunB [Bacilli bacterium]